MIPVAKRDYAMGHKGQARFNHSAISTLNRTILLKDLGTWKSMLDPSRCKIIMDGTKFVTPISLNINNFEFKLLFNKFMQGNKNRE